MNKNTKLLLIAAAGFILGMILSFSTPLFPGGEEARIWIFSLLLLILILVLVVYQRSKKQSRG